MAKLWFKYIRIILPVLFMILLFANCERELQNDLILKNDIFLVDALITNETTSQEIFIQYFEAENHNQPIPINNARVKLIGDGDTINFMSQNDLSGKYISENSFGAKSSVTYKLVVNYQQKSDTAYAIMGEIDPLKPISIVNHDTIFRVIYQGSSKASMMEIRYDWSGNSAYCTSQNSCEAMETFYTINTIDVLKEFAPQKEIISFPLITNIIRTKYSLSQQHEAFVRSLLIETEWRGGLFDVEQGNVPTNFKNGARGWFAVCMVERDTIYFD